MAKLTIEEIKQPNPPKEYVLRMNATEAGALLGVLRSIGGRAYRLTIGLHDAMYRDDLNESSTCQEVVKAAHTYGQCMQLETEEVYNEKVAYEKAWAKKEAARRELAAKPAPAAPATQIMIGGREHGVKCRLLGPDEKIKHGDYLLVNDDPIHTTRVDHYCAAEGWVVLNNDPHHVVGHKVSSESWHVARPVKD